MSARLAVAMITALLGASCVSALAPALPEGVTAQQFLDQCAGKDGWSDPAPPIRLFGNVYDVGTCGIVSLLIVGSEGDILIDSGPADAARLVAANIERLGFKPGDVKWILTSHPHNDHVGGVAELLRLTGARLAASAAAKPALESGGQDPGDPQASLHLTFPVLRVDRVLADGEALTLGNLALTLHATLGHTPGSTSWTWRSCEGDTCRKVAYVDSVTPVSADDYRFSDHPAYVAQFAASLDRIATLDCELLITPHPSASTLYERLAGHAPLTDPQACLHYADRGRQGLDARLAKERGE